MKGDRGHVDSAYLDRAADLLSPVKMASDRLLDITPGALVVDVGCGPGGDVLRLAGAVGSTGQVIGVDADPTMVAEARERIRASGQGTRASVELAPAGRLPMQSCTVDACRSDRLLMHLETPAEAIGEMVRILKPGGRVVCIEPDWATLSIDCESTEVERRLARFTAESALAFGFAGRRLPSLMSRAGLEDRSVEVHAVSVSNYRLARYLVCFDRVHVAATDAGLVTEDELGRLYGELELAEREHRFYGSLNLVVAAGRKRPVI